MWLSASPGEPQKRLGKCQWPPSQQGQPRTCGEHLLQVQHCVDQGLPAHLPACGPLQGGQGSARQDAAGACRAGKRSAGRETPLRSPNCPTPLVGQR